MRRSISDRRFFFNIFLVIKFMESEEVKVEMLISNSAVSFFPLLKSGKPKLTLTIPLWPLYEYLNEESIDHSFKSV